MNARTLYTLSLLAIAGTLAGCASSQNTMPSTGAPAAGSTASTTPAAEPPGAAGLAALDDNDFDEARAALESTIELCGTSTAGQHATLLLAAAAVDPRYDEPDLAAALTSAFLSQPNRSDWATHVAQSIYLVARSVGGDAQAESVILTAGPADQFPPECDLGMVRDAAGDSVAVPSFDSPSWPARLWRRTSEVRSLEAQVDSLTAELDRIRETLRQ